MGRKKVIDGGTPPNNNPNCIANLNRSGHASTFTEEMGERIIDLIWEGHTITDVCKMDGIPARRTIHTWKEKYPEFAYEMYKAQVALGDIYVGENQDIKKELRAGKIDPSSASVLIKSNQWLAIASDPRTYGSKSYVNNTTNNKTTTEYINRIDITGLTNEQLDALEEALQPKMLTGPGDG